MRVCKDLCLILILILIFMEFEVWLPQPFHVLRGRSTRLFTFVDPAKDHRLETHLGHKSSDHSWMTERIKLPAIFRSEIEFFAQEVVSSFEIPQDVCVVCRGFIWWHKATMDNFKSLLLDERLNEVSFLLIDLLIVASEIYDIAHCVSVLFIVP